MSAARASRARSTARRRLANTLSVCGEIAGLLAQIALIVLGAVLLYDPVDDDVATEVLLAWCLIGTAYLGVTVIGLNILVRISSSEPRMTRTMLSHPLMRLLSTVLSFGASALGLVEALSVIIGLGEGHTPFGSTLLAVWSMLLAWALFHWGYARVYYSLYHRAVEPPLLFPGTPDPELSDFVYFSFTNATNFSVSDVQVASSRMRWTVVWHTCFAFFFNALIIALAMNVLSNGNLFRGLTG